jgi:hypothetical protein
VEKHMKQKELLEEVLKIDRCSKFVTQIEKLAVIDAFAEFSQNPTSKSAGYGIEENYSFIGQNLAKRYNFGRLIIESILTFLKESFEKMLRIDYDIYFWWQAIGNYIKERYPEEFLKWYDSLYNDLTEEKKRKFLVLLYALYALLPTSSIRDFHKWFVCFFDKEEKSSENDLAELLVQLGMGNILYYKSSSGHVENRFTPSYFLGDLRKRFENEVTVNEKQIQDFFNDLTLGNTKLIERCMKETVPVLESKMGKVTQTSPLIVEASKSYFAVSPFALEKLRELIKAKKLGLTKEWKEKFDRILNTLVKEIYPCAELKNIFEIDGAFCWEIKYTDSPEKEPISVGVLLSPYLFIVSGYSTILDEARRTMFSCSLNLVFLLRETLPTISEGFRFVNQKNLIFLLNEEGEKFYAIERSEKIPEDKAIMTDSFLSRFLPVLENEIRVSKTWPAYLEEYMENLRYFNKFPKLATIKNRIPALELRLRNTLRTRLEKAFGSEWKEKVKERMSDSVRKLESIVEKRPDKKDVKDFLDGATLGELVQIARSFSGELGIERNAIGHLDLITQHRKTLEHPLKDQESDLDEKTYKTIKFTLDYVEEIICSE